MTHRPVGLLWPDVPVMVDRRSPVHFDGVPIDFENAWLFGPLEMVSVDREPYGESDNGRRDENLTPTERYDRASHYRQIWTPGPALSSSVNRWRRCTSSGRRPGSRPMDRRHLASKRKAADISPRASRAGSTAAEAVAESGSAISRLRGTFPRTARSRWSQASREEAGPTASFRRRKICRGRGTSPFCARR